MDIYCFLTGDGVYQDSTLINSRMLKGGRGLRLGCSLSKRGSGFKVDRAIDFKIREGFRV